jgi:hypothetical protein
MKPCLSFGDVLEVGQPRIAEMERIGDMYPNGDSAEACAAFTHQVGLVEGTVVQTYGIAAVLARRADDLKEVAEIWTAMSQFCQRALVVLSRLKDKYPYCGTSQLHDAVLDYKLAADKRYRGVMEEAECQKMDFPKDLLPELS